MIDQNTLKENLSYCPASGQFTWLKPKGAVKAGDIAGGKNSSGYIRIKINQNIYQGHRLAFLYMTGLFPVHDIDHIDHVRHNNKWSNLREAAHTENHKNRSLPNNNTSGIVGVHWHKARKKWYSKIQVSGKQIHLGMFKTFSEAAEARVAAELEYGFHKNHGGLNELCG